MHVVFIYVDFSICVEAYSRVPAYSKEDKSHFDLADQLQDLHATILGKMDQLDEMRERIREEYVPSAVCQNLEQCLKDTEVTSPFNVGGSVKRFRCITADNSRIACLVGPARIG